MQTRNNFLEQRLAVAELRINERNKLIEEAEQYSRRHSLRLHGVDVKYNETTDDVLNSMKAEIKRMNLTIHDIEIDRAYITGPSYTDKHGMRQQSVLVKFTSWNARDRFFEGRKNSNFYIKLDLTSKRNVVFNKIIEQINDKRSVASKFLN